MKTKNSNEQTQEHDIREFEMNEEINYVDLNEVNDGGVNVDNLDVNGDGEQNENVDVGDEKGDDENDCENNDNQDQFQRKKRKRVSKAHADLSEVTSKDGSIKLQCIHCKTLLSKSSSATTSHLWNHLSRCIQKKLQTKNQKTLQFQNAKSKFETPPLSDGKYDHMKQREAIAHWILMHEQPLNVVENYGFTFMFKVNLPQFEKVSRAMAKNDVSTVASEATFSADTRVLDPYRAKLSSDMVQVLVCGADWVRQLHGINKPIMTHEEEESVDVILRA